MKGFLIFIGVGGIAGSLFLYYQEQVRLANQYTFDVDNIKLSHLSGTSVTLIVRFKITSYSSIEAQVSNLNIGFTVNGTYVGTGYQTGAMTIPALGYNFITVNLQLLNDPFFSNLLTIANQPADTQINISVDGTVKIKSGFIGINLPFQTTYTPTITQLLAGI